eukprot:c2287_g1_i1.p1 GENE.c2287_g1_i1~~c2287_g1_i1.p1  ORF type:complete len:105 (+),score=30.89 c2287_g1_i1:31-315(+)
MPSGPKFPVIDPAPTLSTGVRNFGLNDYLIWGGITGFSLPYGYIVGKPARVQTMWAAGAIGCLGGFMFVLQNSFSRLMGNRQNDLEVQKYLNKK